MLPPPPAEYESANELFKNVQTLANSQGYILVKKRIVMVNWKIWLYVVIEVVFTKILRVLLKKHTKDIKTQDSFYALVKTKNNAWFNKFKNLKYTLAFILHFFHNEWHSKVIVDHLITWFITGERIAKVGVRIAAA